jgi:branched-chain amino acid aminotransferase
VEVVGRRGDAHRDAGCGPAVVGRVKGADRSWTVADGTPGPVTMRVREELVGIQYGARSDAHGWVHKIA